jgi:TP53 regulating kinase-like protein
MAMKVLGSGAEATIFLDEEKGVKRVIKERVPKAYRLPQLDEELRRTRTRREANILRKLPIPGPRLFETDDRSRIAMEFVEGMQVKKLLDKDASIARLIGERLARLHDADIIHGDLTTSNMIMRERELLFIDFGLSFTSKEVEDKAVDIHLFRQALESKHFRVQERAYEEFLRGYGSSRHAPRVLDRLKLVERRGRNKAKW